MKLKSDNPPGRIIGIIRRNSVEETRIRLVRYRKSFRVDFRVFYRRSSFDDDLVPTKRGITIPIHDFEEFMNLMERVREALVEQKDEIRQGA